MKFDTGGAKVPKKCGRCGEKPAVLHKDLPFSIVVECSCGRRILGDGTDVAKYEGLI